MKNFKEKADLIWRVADLLRGDYKQSDYGKVKKDAEGNLVSKAIEDYFETEVKPHLPDAWIDHSKTKIGYEINFTKYFYEFMPLRPLAQISDDIFKLEHDTQGLIMKIIN